MPGLGDDYSPPQMGCPDQMAAFLVILMALIDTGGLI